VAFVVDDVQRAVRELGLQGQAICVHSSLRSFGFVEGGARAIVRALLAESCTVLVPTFSWDGFQAAAPPEDRPAHNGADYDWTPASPPRVFTPDVPNIDADMGAIPAAVLAMPGHVRGYHPLCSFAAVGQLAAAIVAGQRPDDVFAPLRTLASMDGRLVMMGVGLTSMTALHVAEQLAGRRMFIRWALATDGSVIATENGGCSEGFEKLAPFLAALRQVITVGESAWSVYPARQTIEAAAAAIQADPRITHCGREACRCDDAVMGGPVSMRSET